MPKYFDYVQRHPRTLVGEQVPSMTGDGMEVLRDSADAKDWQDAVKEQLALEVRDRAQRRLEDDRGTLDMIHGSIELFQNNPDLVPGTRQFDAQLAADFVRVAKPYEVRTDGKLQGYSIPGGGLRVIRVARVVTARREAAATVVARTGRVVVDRVQTYDGTGDPVTGPGRDASTTAAPIGLVSTPALPGTASRWFFAGTSLSPGTRSQVALFNPSSEDARVDVVPTYQDPTRNAELEPV